MPNPTGQLGALPPWLAQRVRAVLEPDEQVVWAGQPRPGRFAIQQGLPAALLGLLWLAMASPLLAGPWVLAPGGSLLIVKVGLFGVGAIIAAFATAFLTSPAWARVAAVRIAYVVTDRRALEIWPRVLRRGKPEATSYTPQSHPRIKVRVRPDGCGNVSFGDPSEAFIAIDHAEDVAEQVRRVWRLHRAGDA